MLPCPNPGPQRQWELGFPLSRYANRSSLRGQGSTEPILCRGERTRGAWTPTNEQEQSCWHLLGLYHRRLSGGSDTYHPTASLPRRCQGTRVRSLRSCIYPAAARTQARLCQQKLRGSLSSVPLHSVQWLSRVWLLATPWPAARQASLSSPTPGACSNLCPSSRWCHPTVSSSVIPFSSCPQSSPASEGKLTWQ